MTQEEKFKEAERLYRTANADQRYVLEYIFPELCESENEKIRKELITHCRNTRCVTEEGAKKIAKWIAWLEKQGEQKPQRMISAEAKEALYDKPVGKAEPFDKYEGLTDFERTLADICIGWIGEEPGWKQYIKDNSDVLLRIATEKLNSVQDAPSEQKPAWSEGDETLLSSVINSLLIFEDSGASKMKIDWLKHIRKRIKGE